MRAMIFTICTPSERFVITEAQAEYKMLHPENKHRTHQMDTHGGVVSPWHGGNLIDIMNVLVKRGYGFRIANKQQREGPH